MGSRRDSSSADEGIELAGGGHNPVCSRLPGLSGYDVNVSGLGIFTTLRHLLTMTPGLDFDESKEWESWLEAPNQAAFIRDRSLVAPPGELPDDRPELRELLLGHREGGSLVQPRHGLGQHPGRRAGPAARRLL